MRNAISYPHLAARLFNTPLLIHPAKLDAIVAGLGGRMLGGALQFDAGMADLSVSADLFTSTRGKPAKSGEMYSIADGIAMIDIMGVLVHRGRMQPDSSYLTGYQDIARALDAAMADPNVGGILLNVDSPGGEAAGAFDLASKIAALRGAKPIHAAVSDSALSAGYLIASAAGSVSVTNTGYLGSIGVVMRHIDYSQQLASDGIKVTHIYAGAHKVDGNPFEPLAPSVRDSMQAEVQAIYDNFINTVAANRRADPAALRALEADVLRGPNALAAHLADRIATPDQVFSELRDQVNRSRSLRAPARNQSSLHGGKPMSDPNLAGDHNPALTHTQADIDKARAEAHAAGIEAGNKQGVETERARVSGILTHAEAEGREALARQCIVQGLSVEQSGALLAAMPKAPETSPGAGNAFAAAMGALGNPGVKPDAAATAAGDDTDLNATVNSIVTLFQGGRAAA